MDKWVEEKGGWNNWWEPVGGSKKVATGRNGGRMEGRGEEGGWWLEEEDDDENRWPFFTDAGSISPLTCNGSLNSFSSHLIHFDDYF